MRAFHAPALTHPPYPPPSTFHPPQEIRESIAATIKTYESADITVNEKDLFDSCSLLQQNFERLETKQFVETLLPTSPFVEFSMRLAHKGDRRREYHDDSMIGRGVGTGKGVADIDARVEDAVGWLFDMCSRERMRFNGEDNDRLPRIILSSNGTNSIVSATLKSMPFPLHPREFVVRMMWLKLDDKQVAIVVQSINQIVDYGMATTGIVRGSTTAFQVLQPTGPNSCSIVLYQKADLGGIVPVWLLNSKIKNTLNTVNNLRIAFQRDVEVDLEDRKKRISELTGTAGGATTPTPNTDEEEGLDEDEKVLFDVVAESVRSNEDLAQRKQRILTGSGSDHFVNIWRHESTTGGGARRKLSIGGNPMFAASSKRNRDRTSFTTNQHRQHHHQLAIFVAEVLVDTDACNCVAWQMSKCSRQRSLSFFENDGGAFRSERVVSIHRCEISDIYLIGRKRVLKRGLISSGLLGDVHSKFLAKTELLWKHKHINGVSSGYVVVECNNASEEVRSRLSTTHPLNEAESFVSLSTPAVEEWKADAVIDEGIMAATKSNILQDLGIYTFDENHCLDLGRQIEKKVASDAAQIKPIKTTNTLIDASTASVEGVVYGRGTCLVRADVIDILSWYWGDIDYKFTTKYERGSSTVEVKKLELANSHNMVGYGRYSTPFSDREFVARFVWQKEGEGQYIAVSSPTTHEKVPLSSSVVRAEALRFYRFQQVSPGVSRLTLTFKMDLKGVIPLYITNTFVIPANLENLSFYQLYFQLKKSESELDKNGEDATMLSQIIMGELFSQGTTSQERNATLLKYVIRASSLRSIATQYPWFQVLLWHIIENEPMQACIPCSTPLIAFALSDASNVGGSFAACLRGSLAPQFAVNKWIATYPAMVQLDAEFASFIRPFITRIAKCLLEKAENIVDKVGTMSETQFETSEHLLGVPQTKVLTKFTFLGTGSSALTEEEQVLAETRHLSELRKSFDKSVEVDSRRREELSKIIKMGNEFYTDEEEEMINVGTRAAAAYDEIKTKTRAKSSSPLTKSTASYLAGDSLVWGQATTHISAQLEDVLAFLWDSKARNQWKAGTLDKQYLEMPNSHHRVEYILKESHIDAFSNREFFNHLLWKQLSDGTMLLASVPSNRRLTDSEKNYSVLPKNNTSVVRGELKCMYKLKQESTGVRAELLLRIDFGGTALKAIQRFFLAGNLKRLTDCQQFFQEHRVLRDYEEKDGAAIGEVFMMRSKEEKTMKRRKGTSKLQIRVANVVNKHAGLKECTTTLYPWFPSLVEGMLCDWLADPKVINTKLDNLSSKEALAIGQSFSLALYDRQQADVAVDMFVNEYVSLVELRKKIRFFNQMAVVIGQRKLEQAPWGLIFKVGTGAILGVLDVATDLYTIANFTMQGKHGFAKAVVAMVSVSMVSQLLIVCVQGKKRGLWHLTKEALIVVTGLKPAVDAFRIISGTKAHLNDAIEKIFEHTISKLVEVVAESIPSALVQIYAIIESSDKVNLESSLVSIVISVTTISFVTTTMCFDFDLDPEKRVHTPDFYGYVPNTSGQRTIVFSFMFLFTACHVGVRLLGVALLAVLNPTITALVLGGDLLIYFLLKIARKDLRYWLRLDGWLSWVASLLLRFFTKLMVDFTVMVQLRHPQEIGGLYWITCLLIGQATSFVAVYLYSRSIEKTELSEGFYHRATSSHDLWVLVGALEAAFVLFFGSFIATMRAKYRSTFFSTMTAKRFVHERFRKAGSDSARSDVLNAHPSYYEDIRDEVEVWVRENYSAWVDDSPDWFTERLRANIPIDMIPKTTTSTWRFSQNETFAETD